MHPLQKSFASHYTLLIKLAARSLFSQKHIGRNFQERAALAIITLAAIKRYRQSPESLRPRFLTGANPPDASFFLSLERAAGYFISGAVHSAVSHTTRLSLFAHFLLVRATAVWSSLKSN